MGGSVMGDSVMGDSVMGDARTRREGLAWQAIALGLVVGGWLLVSPSLVCAQAAPDAPGRVLVADEALATQVRRTSEQHLAGLRRDAGAYYVGGILATVLGAGGAAGGVVLTLSSLIVGGGSVWVGPLVAVLGSVVWQGGLAMIVVGSRIDVETDRVRQSLELTIAPTEGGAMAGLTYRF